MNTRLVDSGQLSRCFRNKLFPNLFQKEEGLAGGTQRALVNQLENGCGGPICTECTMFEHTVPQRIDPFRRVSLKTKRLHAWFRLAGNPGPALKIATSAFPVT